MKISGLGVDIPDRRVDGRRQALIDTLTHAQAVGFTLARGAEREAAALRKLAPIAEDSGVVIGMENGDPHLWEYRVLKEQGKSRDDLAKYHARMRTSAIVRQVEAVNHPNVRITLDLGHLYLATQAMGEDYLEAISVAAPWVCHLHINDNFGKLDAGVDYEGYRLPYGEADLHLPPGWGALPFAEAFARLNDYEGDIVLEIKERYRDHLEEAMGHTRLILRENGHELDDAR